MTRINGIHIWFVLSLAAAVALPPLLLRAEPDGLEACRRRIAAMPQPERDRMQRNYNEFLAMDESQRNHYRDMHRRLQEDRQEAQAVHFGLFENYTAWLKTIQPHRRNELERTTDSAQRLNLMQQIVEEEAEREVQEEMELVLQGVPRQFRGRFRDRLFLEESRYRSMMAEIERSIDLSSEERTELENLTGLERTFRLFQMIQDKGIPVFRALDASEVNRIIERAELESLVDSLRESQDSERDPDSSQRDPQRGVLMAVLWSNVRKEYEVEVHQRQQPSEASLKELLNQLGEEDQDALLRLPPDEFHQQLRERYAADVGNLDWNVVARGLFGRNLQPDGGRPVGFPGRPGFRSEGGPRLEGRGDRPRDVRPERRNPDNPRRD